MTAKIAVLVSGGGTNLQALIDAQQRSELGGGEITAVISSKEGAYALERARKAGIPGYVLPRKSFDSNRAMTLALVEKLKALDIDLVVLAGCMVIFTEELVQAYPNAIMNVHPALIPAFCGQGFYGLHVHEAALAYGVKLSGATVHFVSAECDGGPIIAQKAVPATADDLATAQDLLDTLTAHKDSCVGMAANMIGVCKRIIAFDNEGTYMVMFNPVIVRQSGPYEAQEGCLSLAGVRKTKRFQTIKVQWQNEKFQTRLKTFTGWTAEIIQHEIDHCEGILI